MHILISNLFYKNFIFLKINFIENVAISTLWSLVRLDGKENSTTNSALVALSKFKKTHFKCSHFPALVINFIILGKYNF